MIRNLFKSIVLGLFTDNLRLVRKLKGGYWANYNMAYHGSDCFDVWEPITEPEYLELHYARQHSCPNASRIKVFENHR